MRNHLKKLGVLAALALLTLSTPALPQTSLTFATSRIYFVRGLFYTAPARQQKLVDAASPLASGTMTTENFLAELQKLASAGQVSIESRPSGSVRAGVPLQLSAGRLIPVINDVVGDKKSSDTGHTSGYILEGGFFNVTVEEHDGDRAATLNVDTETNEITKGGSVYRTGLKTSVTIRQGTTAVFALGAHPDNKRRTYLALSVEPVK